MADPLIKTGFKTYGSVHDALVVRGGRGTRGTTPHTMIIAWMSAFEP